MQFVVRKCLNYLCLVILSISQLCYSMEQDLSIYVEPGQKQCFFQFISEGTKYETEFQVIEGGELDLNFVITGPNGRVIISKQRSTEAMHKGKAEVAGDYQFCLDNTMSRFARKLVFFELLTDDENEDNQEQVFADLPADETLVDMKMEDMKAVLDGVKLRLERSQDLIRVMKAIEARDRSIAEDNFTRVNFWSIIHTFVLLSVGLVQVLMIRNFFTDHKPSSGGSLKLRT